jgi:hypothetical protein
LALGGVVGTAAEAAGTRLDGPTEVSVTPGDGQVTVSWETATSDGGASYSVTSSPGGFSCSTTAMTCTIAGLTDGVAYTFSVIESLSGSESTPVVTNPVTPEAPVSVEAVMSSRSATITWKPSSSSTPAGFAVSASPGGAACSTTTASCVISNLVPNTGYVLTVTPGEGSAAPPSTLTVRTGTVVTSLTLSFVGKATRLTGAVKTALARFSHEVASDNDTSLTLTGSRWHWPIVTAQLHRDLAARNYFVAIRRRTGKDSNVTLVAS